MVERTEMKLTPEPHYIPGYTGYCPNFIYRCAHTYGTLTHLLLIDPCVNHGKNLILTNNCSRHQASLSTDFDIIKNREERKDAIYKQPILPGYKGFVPRVRNKFGQTFSLEATKGISEFETQFLKKQRDNQNIRVKPALRLRNCSNKSIQKGLNNNFVLKKDGSEKSKFTNDIDQMDLHHLKNKPTKIFENKLSNNDFNHQNRTDWSPILAKGIGIKPLLNHEQHKIYFEDRGLVPGYTGYVPGYNEKYGETFGALSIDAKRATYCWCN